MVQNDACFTQSIGFIYIGFIIAMFYTIQHISYTIISYNTSCNYNNMGKHVGYLEHVFLYFDEDGDGKISPSELRNRLGLMGGDELIELKEAEEAVESLDSDGDGLLGLEDLARLMELGGEEEEKMKDLRMAFEMYDVEGKGFITPKSLKRMLSRLGESRSVDECKVMINHFDLNGDGVLSFEEFRIMMQ